MNSAGSTWQKWDLHIHTPASFHWTGQRFDHSIQTQADASCKAMLAAMEAVDVVAFAIMDYWTFDGYLLLRRYVTAHPNEITKRVFPGIEIRLEAPTDYRLNAHVLLSDELPPETLNAFLMHLKLSGPDSKPLTRPTFIEVGRSFDDGKLRHHGFKPEDRADEEKMFQLGMITAEVSTDSLKDAIQIVKPENCLFILPYDTSDGIEHLDWKAHPFADTTLMKWADCFESRRQAHVDLFLGRGHPSKPSLGPEFIANLGGLPKPVFSGSDAHRVDDYGVYPSDRITWLKAQTTFKGLKQVCHEAGLRCHIGLRPPKLDHVAHNPTKYMKRVKLTKNPDALPGEHWFDGQDIELNCGLIAIIGNKGSGKSALADILALAGNSHCTKMEFLNDRRFRSSGNKAKHFTASLAWVDGSIVEVPLDRNADLQQPERVRYLPQHYIEDLCNEIASGNETNFGKELRKVIFAHVPEENQLRMGTLDELLEYLIAARRKAFAQVQQSLRVLNETIVRNETEISDDTLKSYKTALALKQKELDAHDKSPPAAVEKPEDDPDDDVTRQAIERLDAQKQELEQIKTELAEVKIERAELVAQSVALTRLLGHVENFKASHTTFVESHQDEFEEQGFVIGDIVKVTIDREPLTNAAKEVTSRLAKIDESMAGKPATETEAAILGLQAKETACLAAIAKEQEGLNAPQKAYQAYMKELAQWEERRSAIVGAADKPDTVEYYKDRIKRATEVIPTELEAFRKERRELVRKLHLELLAVRNTYVELYAPVQEIAEEAASGAGEPIQLEFDAYISTAGFDDNFLDFIHRNRKGTFYGEEDSRKAVRELLQAHDFNSTESVVAFTDAILAALTTVERDGKKETVTIASQLRDKKKLSNLYDYIFGLEYLETRYTLRLGGKDITQLSPGEKGALLLVFYLLLDTEEIPIIIDQPEHNLDNESVVRLLVNCIRRAGSRRQVIIVTHNPNLAVFCDADQIIYCRIDKTDGHRITYDSGAIEDYEINQVTVNVLEGTYPAFDNRRKKYHKPLVLHGPATAPV